jgi:hypothetical protein
MLQPVAAQNACQLKYSLTLSWISGPHRKLPCIVIAILNCHNSPPFASTQKQMNTVHILKFCFFFVPHFIIFWHLRLRHSSGSLPLCFRHKLLRICIKRPTRCTFTYVFILNFFHSTYFERIQRSKYVEWNNFRINTYVKAHLVGLFTQLITINGLYNIKCYVYLTSPMYNTHPMHYFSLI